MFFFTAKNKQWQFELDKTSTEEFENRNTLLNNACNVETINTILEMFEPLFLFSVVFSSFFCGKTDPIGSSYHINIPVPKIKDRKICLVSIIYHTEALLAKRRQ